MATILQPIDFLDVDSKNSVSLSSSDWVSGGDNVFLLEGDGYYSKLLRDYSIDPLDPDLVDPPIYQVKKILICYVETLIFKTLMDDSRAPFEGQQILTDKYSKKLKEAKLCLKNYLSELDENAFTGGDKGTDTPKIGRFGRG